MSDAVPSLHQRTGCQLRAAFGDSVLESPDEPAYFVPRGRIGVRVGVQPAGEDDAVLEVYSWIAQGLPVSPELGLYLAERNATLRFGLLSIDGEGAIILQHALFREETSEQTLARLVGVMAETADVLDRELLDRFG